MEAKQCPKLAASVPLLPVEGSVRKRSQRRPKALMHRRHSGAGGHLRSFSRKSRENKQCLALQQAEVQLRRPLPHLLSPA